MYNQLAPIYETIFPLNQTAFEYLDQVLRPAPAQVLDVGCGTGAMARALVDTGRLVTGVDPSPEMIHEADRRSNHAGGVRWVVGGMLEVGQEPLDGPWDAVLCLGNTLPHLPDMKAIERFIKRSFGSLESGGMLVLQTVNFHRFSGARDHSFPPLDRNGFQFHRTYERPESSDRVIFHTRLEGPDGLVITGRELLFPISASQLIQSLETAGFTDIHVSGSFKGDEYGPDSPALVVRSVKPA